MPQLIMNNLNAFVTHYTDVGRLKFFKFYDMKVPKHSFTGEYCLHKTHVVFDVHEKDKNTRSCVIKCFENKIRVNVYNSGEDWETELTLPTGMTEEEFFQESLILDMLGIDYPLYCKLESFRDSVCSWVEGMEHGY